MDIWSVKDKCQKKRAHIFFNFFVCIFCEMIGTLYLTTKNDANEKTHSIFHVLTWKLKLS